MRKGVAGDSRTGRRDLRTRARDTHWASTAPDASAGEGSPAPPSRAPNPKGRLRARTRSTSSSTRERRSSASLTGWRSQYRSVSTLGCSGLHVRLVSWHESAVPWRGRCVAGDRCRKEGQGSRSAGAGRVTKGRCWRGCPSAPTHLQRALRGGRRVTKALRLPLLRKHGRLRHKTRTGLACDACEEEKLTGRCPYL